MNKKMINSGDWKLDANGCSCCKGQKVTHLTDEERKRIVPPGTVTKGPCRNSPCLCGSGKKYKKCCIGVVDVKPAQGIAT